MVFYFRYEKQRVERQRIAEAAKGMGKPKVGGKFELVDHDGKPFSSAEGMGGKFSLVSLDLFLAWFKITEDGTVRVLGGLAD